MLFCGRGCAFSAHPALNPVQQRHRRLMSHDYLVLAAETQGQPSLIAEHFHSEFRQSVAHSVRRSGHDPYKDRNCLNQALRCTVEQRSELAEPLQADLVPKTFPFQMSNDERHNNRNHCARYDADYSHWVYHTNESLPVGGRRQPITTSASDRLRFHGSGAEELPSDNVRASLGQCGGVARSAGGSGGGQPAAVIVPVPCSLSDQGRYSMDTQG
jgi:hypothetical protein